MKHILVELRSEMQHTSIASSIFHVKMHKKHTYKAEPSSIKGANTKVKSTLLWLILVLHL